MSSLGYQWIHGLLVQAGFHVERAVLPDDLEAWVKAKAPLITLETETPVADFPVIGVSLAYELELAGLIRCLDLAGIPALRRHRDTDHPQILVGGPLTFSNPLPAAPFADAMLLGEADDIVVPALEAFFDGDRSSWLNAVQSLPGGYVPERDGTVLPPVAKASDEGLPARSRLVTPDAELSDMFLIEGERGCHRKCSFCVMRRSTNGGMRLFHPDHIMDLVPDHAPRVGLVGAAISDHPKLVPLLERIVESGRGVGVSSLRADRIALKPKIAELLRKGGYKTLTVASDGASENLRRGLMKGTLEKHLISCAQQAHQHHYRVLKVYMMVGVPGETDSDIDELVRFTRELATIHPTALGVAPFVPKRNTPLDGTGFAGIKVVERRLKRLTRGLRGKATVRPTSARWAWIESVLAQGGPEAGEAVLAAVRDGGRFAAYKRALTDLDPLKQRPWAS
jgi:radical SAM superfamily enzyme YgiQ (UPF0313 family)